MLSPVNGFRTVCVLLKAQHWRSRWLRVPDPASVGARVLWRSVWPSYLYVLAQRVEVMPVLAAQTFQSDYVSTWHYMHSVLIKMKMYL